MNNEELNIANCAFCGLPDQHTEMLICACGSVIEDFVCGSCLREYDGFLCDDCLDQQQEQLTQDTDSRLAQQ